MSNNVFDCKIISLPQIGDRSGHITFVNNMKEVPFDIKRIYYLYDVPGGESRGGHAHYKLQQLLVAVSGSFDVMIDDGRNKQTISLNRPNYGLYITPGIWRDLVNFSSGSVLLVLASEVYEEEDYIRDYNIFKSKFNG
jgi:dTDP-4-dehydrorhamnose 3,5-epimerase-like enzyme